jgi:phosphoribosylformylglycinamidine cyclo-ligase
LGTTLGEALLTPTKIYVRALRGVKESGVTIKGCSHITGGGFYENIPRMLPEGVRAVINNSSYDTPPIFALLKEKGQLSDEVMYNTYNMGLGMVLAVASADADKTVAALEKAGEKAYIVGHIEEQREAGEAALCLC